MLINFGFKKLRLNNWESLDRFCVKGHELMIDACYFDTTIDFYLGNE